MIAPSPTANLAKQQIRDHFEQEYAPYSFDKLSFDRAPDQSVEGYLHHAQKNLALIHQGTKNLLLLESMYGLLTDRATPVPPQDLPASQLKKIQSLKVAVEKLSPQERQKMAKEVRDNHAQMFLFLKKQQKHFDGLKPLAEVELDSPAATKQTATLRVHSPKKLYVLATDRSGCPKLDKQGRVTLKETTAPTAWECLAQSIDASTNHCGTTMLSKLAFFAGYQTTELLKHFQRRPYVNMVNQAEAATLQAANALIPTTTKEYPTAERQPPQIPQVPQISQNHALFPSPPTGQNNITIHGNVSVSGHHNIVEIANNPTGFPPKFSENSPSDCASRPPYSKFKPVGRVG